MAVVVVGGSARGAGKTALICGVIAALPEFAWIAAKLTAHTHANLPGIYEETAGEETAAGHESGTARYLAAGARRAFLVSASDSELGQRLREFRELLGPDANLILESNRVLRHLKPNLCLAIEAEPGAPRKASFAWVEEGKHATVRRIQPGVAEDFVDGPHPLFALARFESLSAPMRQWLRTRLPSPR